VVVTELEGLQILLSNVAIISQGLFWEINGEERYQIIRNNLSTVFYWCRAAAPAMTEQKQGGRIIELSSIRATLWEPQAGSYTTTKGGVEALSGTMATELAPY
jgi:NAD(P)-dependent dehydrogenase (short-subunit alcohol dehydrogenase family)